jgi:hypothetical protein
LCRYREGGVRIGLPDVRYLPHERAKRRVPELVAAFEEVERLLRWSVPRQTPRIVEAGRQPSETSRR